MTIMTAKTISKPEFLEFFAGSGLVTHAMKSYFKVVWANDNSEKKADVYHANHGKKHFHLGSIDDVKGDTLPHATLSWASFPCQDLSLAGMTAGIHASRSGLVWQWLRIMEEMPSCPPLLVAENVTGLVSHSKGAHYRHLHEALRSRDYKVGAVVLNAVHWIPQSRQRVFVIAVRNDIEIPAYLQSDSPTWLHPEMMLNAARGLEDWIWWNLPEPPARKLGLSDIVEWDAPCDPPDKVKRNISLISERHMKELTRSGVQVAPGYKRIRNKQQYLEIRFDNVAGCLRTPVGGSSRQVLVLNKNGKLSTRLLTVRETARLMGAPDSYKLPGTYNDGYKAMGDAVAVPVARYLAKHLLSPLAKAIK